ncbi:restriction endonuclease, partial [Candidatus Nomurabacteria bacterium]|nr:restriction endonuclease [Candidatus Nomurabacteria bacterium]
YGISGREGLEFHAYEFIHTISPEEIFNMKFDVIIGNPPYQLETSDTSRQAKPIYNLFIEQAQKLKPMFLTMIIPSRWFAGGMGMDRFREMMMKDKRVIFLYDFANAKDCFPQNSISGGVCYFLWSKNNPGHCDFISNYGGKEYRMIRDLDEFPTLVRYNEAVYVIRKIQAQNEQVLSEIASSISPFGLPTSVRGNLISSGNNKVKLHSSAGISYISKNDYQKGHEWIGKYKVLVSQTGAEHAGEPAKDGKFKVLTSSLMRTRQL